MANESYYTRKLRKKLETVGLFRKIATGMQSAGISDLIGCVWGRFIAIEAKVSPNEATPMQQAFLSDTVNNGGIALLVTYHKDTCYWSLLDWTTGQTKDNMSIKEIVQWVSKQIFSSTSKTPSI